jgi:hypothetical protein
MNSVNKKIYVLIFDDAYKVFFYSKISRLVQLIPTLGFESSAYFGSIFTECIIFKTNITSASKYSSKLRRH